MQQGRRSASMKASYEALQNFAQSTDVGVLSLTPTLSLQSGTSDMGASAMLSGGSGHSRKQKKYAGSFKALPSSVVILFVSIKGGGKR